MDGLGTELPQRTSFVWVLALTALVLAIPCLRIARRASGESGVEALGAWAMTAVMILLLVVAPAAIAWSIHRRHTYVSDTAVSVSIGTEVRQQIDFVDLEELRVRVSGTGGDFLRNERIFLIGTLSSGKRGRVVVSRMYVDSLRPLLERLSEELATRPELLSSDLERGYFDRALAVAP